MNFSPEVNALVQHTQLLECKEDINAPNQLLESEQTVIARILTDKLINMGSFKTTILKAWNPKKKVSVNLLQTNTMAFVLEDEADITKILSHSWTFRDCQVIVRKWPPDLSLSEVNLNITSFWVQAFDIPVCFINNDTAKFIGKSIGVFLKADLTSSSHKWKKFLRIQVDLNILEPLKSSVLLPCHGRSDFLIEIRYERLTDFCYNCGLLGHKNQNCVAASTDVIMDSSTLLFGPWLKSENPLIPNPSFSSSISTHITNPERSSLIPQHTSIEAFSGNGDSGLNPLLAEKHPTVPSTSSSPKPTWHCRIWSIKVKHKKKT